MNLALSKRCSSMMPTTFLLVVCLFLLPLVGYQANDGDNGQRQVFDAPPPPTPGPPPTVEVQAPEVGERVESAQEALQIALELDRNWTDRQPPLTEAIVEANPEMVIVERYATRQEAAAIYSGSEFGNPEIASEPVWIVRIKGDMGVKVVGLGGIQRYGDGGSTLTEADGVTYTISQVTGALLSLGTTWRK